ncbi:hypothetical protein BDN72DRAFT_859911 [Pluteus cervinus]|uniref:Uncharacterized protein n=1 Tax=Pluteus cervinus TaxID=181527 RepID=A0ACD3ALQ1_9AGAR|nr:hypothetical protein BDN72DRAFT_859911 [Pluteus cervinus]
MVFYFWGEHAYTVMRKWCQRLARSASWVVCGNPEVAILISENPERVLQVFGCRKGGVVVFLFWNIVEVIMGLQRTSKVNEIRNPADTSDSANSLCLLRVKSGFKLMNLNMNSVYRWPVVIFMLPSRRPGASFGASGSAWAIACTSAGLR